MAEGLETNPPIARVHDLATGKLLTLLRGSRHGDQARRLAFSPDGKRLISQEFGGIAQVWDAANGTLLHRLGEHDRVSIDAVGFTLDGRAVTGGSDRALRLGSVVVKLAGHKDRVSAIAVSPMDGIIASGDWSGEIRLWDGSTGAPLRTLAKQRAPVHALRISPNGRFLLSAEEFGDWVYGARVWELATGKEVHAYAGHDNTRLGCRDLARQSVRRHGRRQPVCHPCVGPRNRCTEQGSRRKAFDTRRNRRAALGRWLLGGRAKHCVGTELDKGE